MEAITGANRLRAFFEQIPAAVENTLDDTLQIIGRRIVKDAKAGSWVDTGHQRSSIRLRRKGKGRIEINVGAPYAIYQEYGTKWRAADPFLSPAVNANTVRLNDELSRAVQATIEATP